MNKNTRVLWFGCFLLAFFLGLTSLNRGFQSDDYIHRQMLLDENTGYFEQINNFYRFLGPTDNIPWWTEEGLKISFWRPLSASTHWIDYQLWPDSSTLMHVHNAFWYALLVVLVLGFHRRLLDTKLALLATLVFCLDFSHFSNISWIANRNSLIAACLILVSFNNFVDWKQKQKIKNYIASVCAFALALLSAEAGIVLLVLLVLHEYFFFRKNLFSYRTLLAFTPFALVTTFWFLLYQTQGYGIANNSMYFSPTENILESFSLLLIKIPVFIFGNITTIEGFLNVFPLEIQALIAFLCASSLLFIIFLLKNQFKENSSQFFLTSSVIVLVPVCFIAVTDMRLSLFSSVFCAALLAQILYAIKENKTIIYRSLFYFLISAHFIISPLQWLYVGARDFANPPKSFSQFEKLEQFINKENIFILNYPSPIDAYYYPFTKDGTSTSTIHVLNNNFSNYTIEIENSNELILKAEMAFIFKNNDFSNLNMKNKPIINGVYARSSFNGMLSNDFHFSKGDRFDEEHFVVDILENNQYGQITKMRFRFKESLKSGHILYWNTFERNFSKLSLLDLEKAPIFVKNF